MKTSIEKSLSRLAGKIEAIESRLDAIQQAAPSASAFSGGHGEYIGDVIAAAGLDNVASVTSRLRALHEGTGGVETTTAKNPFGKPTVAPLVIDGEFTEVRGE